MTGDKERDFETSLQELEAIVERLEVEQLGLDESLKLYQDGVGLARQCQSMLDNARQVIETVEENDAVDNGGDHSDEADIAD